MSTEDNKAVARRMYYSINRAIQSGNVSDLLKGVSPDDFINHDPMPGTKPGLEGVRATFAMIHAGFPDGQVTIEDLIAEGDRVAARITQHGTHTGAFMGMSPTGKSISVSGIEILRIVDGMVVERWGIIDNLSMMAQLGAMNIPPGPH